jgi:hypothetical protein
LAAVGVSGSTGSSAITSLVRNDEASVWAWAEGRHDMVAATTDPLTIIRRLIERRMPSPP